MKQPSDSKKQIAFPVQLYDGPETAIATPREIHIVPTGQWTHWSGYEFEITPDTIAQMAANFRAGVKKDIRATAGHDEGRGTATANSSCGRQLAALYTRGDDGPP